MKRSISTQISMSAIDDIYAQARNAGALGGKLAGAGGGGFLLFYCPKAAQPRLREVLGALQFRFDTVGAGITFAQ